MEIPRHIPRTPEATICYWRWCHWCWCLFLSVFLRTLWGPWRQRLAYSYFTLIFYHSAWHIVDDQSVFAEWIYIIPYNSEPSRFFNFKFIAERWKRKSRIQIWLRSKEQRLFLYNSRTLSSLKLEPVCSSHLFSTLLCFPLLSSLCLFSSPD